MYFLSRLDQGGGGGSSAPSLEDFLSGNVTEVRIPEAMTKLGTYQFYGNKSIQKVMLHDNVTELGNYCFYSCSNMTDIENLKGGEEVWILCIFLYQAYGDRDSAGSD